MSLNASLNPGELLQFQIDDLVSKFNMSSMLFGIAANLLCISVFANKSQLKRRFHYYLLTLAIADLLYCLIVFTNYLVFVLDPPNVLYDLSPLTCYLTDYIIGSIDSISVLTTMILSIDRVYAITRPLKFKEFPTYRFPKLLVLLNVLFCLGLKASEILLHQREFTLESYDHASSHNTTLTLTSPALTYHVCNTRPLFSDQNNGISLYLYIYICNIILPFILHLIPSIVILCFNSVLWIFIQDYTRKRRKIGKEKPLPLATTEAIE